MPTMNIKSLADGQLAIATGDLYTVPASTETIIKTITLVNGHTSAVAVNLYILRSGGTARKIIPKDLSLGVGYLLAYDDEITLEAGDKIQGDADTAAVVDYIISGVEKT